MTTAARPLQSLYPTLPLLLHEKVQRKITSGRENHKEDTQ